VSEFDIELAKDISQFYANPLGFVLYAFDWGKGDLEDWSGPDDWQREFLLKLGKAIRERKPGEVIKISTKTGKGPGKTALEAWLILWLNSTRPHFAGTATANTGDQLDTKLWRELSLWWQRSINKHWFQWTATRFYQVDHKDTWGIDALKWSEHKPDAFGGLHNAGRGQAALVDEGSGVADSIYDVIDSTMTDEDSFIFVFGNPYRKRGRFYDLFTRFAHRWINLTVDCRTAKAPNQSKIQADIEDWGLDSDYIRVNVLGEFPRQDADTLIPLPLIEAARTREAAECERYYPVWGLDVARYGDDRTALCKRRHRRVETVEAWRGLDTMQTAGRVKNAYDEAATDDKPTMIVVDVIGVGAGVVDRLRELGLPVRALNVAEAPAVRAKFHRLRDEMYWRGREWFEGLNVECSDVQVGAELGDVTYGYTSSGQIKVEPKDAIKERLGRSPDVGESLLLSLMEDCQAIPDERSDRYRRARARTQETAWAA
jgi:hypothetical protein